MRIVTPLVVFLGSFLAVLGCSERRPPETAHAVTTDPRPDRPLEVGDGVDDVRHDDVPRVVRRILAEEKDLVARSLALAADLPDAHGRERALAEANDLARELEEIAIPIDGADSATLDDVVSKLLRIDTRVAFLHERMRVATNRSTAVLIE